MKASEIMELIEEYSGNHILMCSAIKEFGENHRESHTYINESIEIRAKLQAFANEYADLKHCYSPDKVFKITEKTE